MKTYIISIKSNEDSVKSTQQAIWSAKEVGYTEPIIEFDAILPETWKEVLPFNNIFNMYPRPYNVAACFASHYMLWKKCIELNEPILILEHDAIFVENIPDIDFKMCVSFGRPSYIRPRQMVYTTPIDGLQPIIQDNFLGHHAYAIKPEAAKQFCADVETRELTANDIWIDKATYPWLEEYRPYPVHADTDFSTIQSAVTDAGLKKHEEIIEGYKKLYPELPNWTKGSFEYNYINQYYPHIFESAQSTRYVKAGKGLLEEFRETSPDIMADGWNAYLREPIEDNKLLLVSWRMAGSEFAKELIRENYPEATALEQWGKTHINLEIELTKALAASGTKVIIVISDPREVALNIAYYENGLHLHDFDYKTKITSQTIDSPEFLNEIAQKQIDLIKYYKRYFKENCTVVRYEDAVYNQENFHKKVSNLLGTDPLLVDDSRKYQWSIYKNVGDYNHFFNMQTLNRHYMGYKKFYTSYKYPESGLQSLKYKWHGNTSLERKVKDEYVSMLKRNGVTITPSIAKRIEGLNEY